ncbi:MAG: DNA topoisomerase 4 subunit A [Candidatus Dadabacteria bacterium]|nr:MAG: DNA topoisomerase 4 subunit A [Candidatus Dadabacteria bacterium]
MAVIETSLKKESRDRYLTYALSVVSGRALPDVRDGLKPVQRRILYAMFNNLKLRPQGNYKKSAAVVGEVLAKYHPHGDLACYEAMVRMAQDFSLRYPLIDGQGNFGSLDGDSAAAYRYTEVRLRELAVDLIGEIDQETVEFRDNFDATTQEPVVLPSMVPNLLINGASGIAVGMATSIPPHNLKEVVKALIELSLDPELSHARITSIIKGPDFPTGCQVLNTKKELTDIYKSGRGTIKMRGEWGVETAQRGKKFIVITSIPYAVNKATLVERIATLIIQKKVPQLLDVRDESTDKVRIVLELKSGADPDVAMAYILKNTPLETNFSVNLTALVPTPSGAGRPELLSLKECLQYFLAFREEVVTRRLVFEKKNLVERIHILEGFKKIFDALDQAIKIVRSSRGRSDAAEKLRKKFKLTEKQAFAIVDLRIYQLSRTSIDEILKELSDKKKRVKSIDVILKDSTKIAALVREDLEKISAAHGDTRRCRIIKDSEEIELNEADYVVKEDVYAIVTRDGWLKRIRQNNDVATTRLREGDRILAAHPVSTLDRVVFFTNQGYMYALAVSEFPSSSGYGTPIQKLLKFRDGESVVDCFAVYSAERELTEFEAAYPAQLVEEDEVILISEQGLGFGLAIESFSGIKRNGKRVIKLKDSDRLAAVCITGAHVAFFTRKGSALVVGQDQIPVRNNPAVGVILMSVRQQDQIVGAASFDSPKQFKLVLTNGKEKEVSSSELLVGRRGLKGRKVLSRGEIEAVTRS